MAQDLELVVGSCKHGNETVGWIKYEDSLLANTLLSSQEIFYYVNVIFLFLNCLP
jgi:hypothetical protein